MPSSYSASLRFELQFTGENVNLWGDKLNAALSRADSSIAGWTTKALTTDYTLTTANGTADEARSAMLKFTGTGAFTVTIPAVSKRYDIWNACTGTLTVSNGSASVALVAGEVCAVITDGGSGIKRIQPTDFGGGTLTSVARVSGLSAPSAGSDAASKTYVDGVAFTMASGSLPGQTANSGKFLTTDGATASWGAVTSLASPTITAPAVSGGTWSAPTVTGGLTLSGGLTLTGGQTLTGSTKQNIQAVSLLDLDLSAADVFTKSISANSTFTFSNTTASKAQGFVLQLTISSAAVPTWPATVTWKNGVNPSSALGNGVHVLGFITADGGTTWRGFVGGIAFA